MPETDRRRDATLAPVKATYETWGREDPFYAVLTSKRRRGNQWDPEVFFDRGRREVDDVIDYVDGLSLRPGTARALDFGCGVGRLTFALADRFDEVVGVDIAESMVDCARRWNDRGERVRFVANARADLSLFADDSFDFVYSSITLQHVPPEAAANYVREFFRVLRPDGVAVFQMPNGPRIEPGSLRWRAYNLRRRVFRRWWKRLRGIPAYEMHWIARSRMTEVVDDGGGELVDVQDLSGGRSINLRYCAVVRMGVKTCLVVILL